MLKFILLISLALTLSVVSCFNFNELYENPYRLMKIAPWSTLDQIKSHYKKEVRINHPDRGGDSEKFIRLQRGWDLMKEVKKEDTPEEGEDPKTDTERFTTYVSETISYALVGAIILWLVSVISSVVYKIYMCSWKFVMYLFVTYMFVDRLVPHYFNSDLEEGGAIFLIAFCLYNVGKVRNLLRSKPKEQ